MDARRESEPIPMKTPTAVERKSEGDLVVTRTINGPARIVFEAWTRPELFKQWWVLKSAGLSLLSCDMDVRVRGRYRLVFRHPAGSHPDVELTRLAGGGMTGQLRRFDSALASRGRQVQRG